MITTLDNSVSSLESTSGTVTSTGPASLVDWFKQFAKSIGLPCACLERDTCHTIARSHADSTPFTPAELSQRAFDINGPEIFSVGEGLLYFLTPVPGDENYLVGGFATSSESSISGEFVRATLLPGWDDLRFDEWLETVPTCDSQILERLLDCSLRSTQYHRHEVSLQLEVNALSQQVDYTSEQVGLLHSLIRNLYLSRSAEEMAELCLDKLRSLMDCSGVAVWLQNDNQPTTLLTQGQLPFNEPGLTRLLKRFELHDWSKPLVRNKLQDTLLGSTFPGLKNIIIASIGDDTHRQGWIVACNLGGGRDFSSSESALLGSVATILSIHARNVRLFQQHDELLLSFVRSLVSSLDAKDVHTRGHSERVALIARRIGEQLKLPENELDDIYLSSLLHDLGKIGVDDRILSKPGKLTAEEFNQIQQHPLIGYEILSPLKNMSKILPGVRSHHEAYNGKGYPDRLRGEEIPLMARIIAVADSYDAMITDRPYRKGMPLAHLEEIFRRGSGEQWDSKVISAYFEVKDEVHALFESYSLSVGNLLDTMDLSQSGIFHIRGVTQA